MGSCSSTPRRRNRELVERFQDTEMFRSNFTHLNAGGLTIQSIIGVDNEEDTLHFNTSHHGRLSIEHFILLNMLLNHAFDRQEMPQPRPAVSEEQFSKLRHILVDNDTDFTYLGNCGITLEEFKVNDHVIVLPCSHAFQESAIKKWFDSHDSCPVCRASSLL